MLRKGSTLPLTQTLAVIGKVILNTLTPQRQLRNLLDNPGKDFVEWERFRDAKCRKWVTLSVTCGLIMGAVATIIFSQYPVGRAAFVLGASSLMSGLIAAGVCISLMYVLGDLRGKQYQGLILKHPILFPFALVLPQMWALICFTTFYLACAITLWEAVGKSWFVKAGVAVSIFFVTTHLVGFVYAIRSPDKLEFSDIRGVPRESLAGTPLGRRVTSE